MRITRSLYIVGTFRYIDIDGTPYRVIWRYKRPVLLRTDCIKTIYEYREGDEVTITSSNDWGFLTLKSIAPCKHNVDPHRVPEAP
jgi:hypothetical protein